MVNVTGRGNPKRKLNPKRKKRITSETSVKQSLKRSLQKVEESTVLARSLRQSLKKAKIPSPKAEDLIAKTVPLVKRAEKKSALDVATLGSRELTVASDLKDVVNVLKEAPSVEMIRVAKQRIQNDQPQTKAEVKKVKQLNLQLLRMQQYAVVFNTRANIAKDATLDTNKRLKLLEDMQKSLVEQESAMFRLKRMLTSPTFWIALSVITLAGFGLYQAPEIAAQLTQLIGSTGKAAESIGVSATSIIDSTSWFVGASGCAAASLALFATGFGAIAGLALAGSCGAAGFTAKRLGIL